MSIIGEMASEKWVPIPGMDHTDGDKLVTVVTAGFDLGNGVPEGIRRVKLLASEGTSLEITFSMKSILPLCQMLLDIVQDDIRQGGELTRKDRH